MEVIETTSGLRTTVKAKSGVLQTAPSEISVTSATGTAASSGDNTLIAAPGAGIRIVLVSIIIQNESSTATTMILKNGSTAYERILAQNQGDGLAHAYPVDARKKLAANAALVLNLSGANSCGYSIEYYTETV